jgi:hypothetical protein
MHLLRSILHVNKTAATFFFFWQLQGGTPLTEQLFPIAASKTNEDENTAVLVHTKNPL